MASTDKPTDTEYGKTEPPQATGAPPSVVETFYMDVVLRFLLFAASLVAVVVLVTSDQTEFVPPVPGDLPQPRKAKFSHSPGLIYFVVAFSVSGLYSIITTLASISVILQPNYKLKFLLHFMFWDTLILGLVASATGAAGAVGYVGLKGNTHVGWVKVCSTYDKFCRHIAGSLAVALFGSVVAVLLIWLSTHSLHARTPK